MKSISNHFKNFNNRKRMSYMIRYALLGIIIFCFIKVWFQSDQLIINENVVKGSNDEIVVIFTDNLNYNDVCSFASSFGIDDDNILSHIDNYALLHVDESHAFNDVMDKFDKDPRVLTAHENHQITLMTGDFDPYIGTQWAINNPGYYDVFINNGLKQKKSRYDVDMDVVEAWEYMKNDGYEHREVIVAVIDTGIDYSHPDLAQNMWVNTGEIAEDGIDNDNNGYVDDIYGWDFYNDDSSICHYSYNKEMDKNLAYDKDNDNHGTHIAGVIGAVAGNNIGIQGVASNIDIKIMSLKINGGTNGTGNISDAIEAIKYATMMNADICNMSWGTIEHSQALFEVMKESDMLFVAASGNTGINNDLSPVYPANFKLDNLLSVTFINSSGLMTNLSNYGKSSVDIGAPGGDIFSTSVGDYWTLSGSSMAVPHVSAVAALLYSYKNNLNPANVKDIITSSIKPIASLKGNIRYPGIPSALNAVNKVDYLESDSIPPNISFETIYDNEKFHIPIYAQDLGGSGIRLIRYISGARNADDFKRGTNGKRVNDNLVTVLKPGKYSFYVSDYAGNENVVIYEVEDDLTAPSILSSYSVNSNIMTVNVRAYDTKSNIKRVKYMKGTKEVSDFLPANAGKEIFIKDGKGFFEVEEDGIYSIYAIDYRGNIIIEYINVKSIASSHIKFITNSKTISVGEQYLLRAYLKPFNTTDNVTFSSSNSKVVKVSGLGRIEALKAGKAYVTARTTSGISAVCVITVVTQ